jgi:hypothetical protein
MPDPILQLQEIAKPCLNAKLYTYRAAADAERYLFANSERGVCGERG